MFSMPCIGHPSRPTIAGYFRRQSIWQKNVATATQALHATTQVPARLVHASAEKERPGRNKDKPRQASGKNKLDIWKNQLARMSSNPRAVAVSQLLRIEEEGAYVGLVGGSPGADASPEASQDDMLTGRNWREKLSDRDARLVTELVAGVTRWRRRLDYLIQHLTKSSNLDALDPPMRQILRMGLYELLEMAAPSHVINEHVQLTKRVMNTGAGGFANGVLRSATRAIEAKQLPPPPPLPPGATAPQVAAALGVAASHPDWMVERWLRQLGRSRTVALLKWNNARPAHTLRLTPSSGLTPAQLCAKLVQQGVAAQPSTYLPHHFIKVQSGLQALLAGGLVSRGEVQVQDEAAGLVVSMLDPQPGEEVMDACAAPGGKTLFAAARMGGKGRILALDISAARLQALQASAERQGYGGMVAILASDFCSLAGGPRGAGEGVATSKAQAPGGGRGGAGQPPAMRRLAAAGSSRQAARDSAVGGVGAVSPVSQAQRPEGIEVEEGVEAGRPAPDSPGAPARCVGEWGVRGLLSRHFDRVLLDAPCSGTGVLAKRADLRWRRQPQDLPQLARLQDALLDAAAVWVKPGGVLVYSTCSLEPEENQERVARFLTRHPEFAAEPPPQSAGISPECLTPEGYLQMLPYTHGTDGAFAARLRRAATA